MRSYPMASDANIAICVNAHRVPPPGLSICFADPYISRVSLSDYGDKQAM
jgi:hypothetical protein